MIILEFLYKFDFGILFCVLFAGSPMAAGYETELHILQDWRGNYPVSELYRLPDGQQTKGIGYIGNILELTPSIRWYYKFS